MAAGMARSGGTLRFVGGVMVGLGAGWLKGLR